MKRERNPTASAVRHAATALLGGTLARGRLFSPTGKAALRALQSHTVRRVVPVVLLLVGLVVQVVLLLVVGYLIDLGISLMELWAELARKHLELTL